MTDESKLSLTAIATVVLTPTCILAVYAQYDVLPYSVAIALQRFNRWPWFTAAIVLTTLSSLIPFFLVWSARGARSRFDNELVAYPFVIVPIAALFLYPGTKALGVDSDPKLFWTIALLCAVHGVHVHVFGRYAWRHAPWGLTNKD